jgi:hypothetical protein
MPLLYLIILICTIPVVVGMSLPLTSRPLACAILIIIAYLYDAQMVMTPSIPLGLEVYPADIVFGLLLVTALLRYVLGRAKLNGIRIILICLFLLYLIGLTRGIEAYGLKEAGNESRAYFYFLSGVLYFSSFNLTAKMRSKIVSAWMAGSVALVGLAIFRWVATLGGLGIAAQWQVNLAGGNLRVLNASCANFMGMAFFASIFLNLQKMGPAWQRKAFYLLGPVILILQHRTVWGVMLGGILWLVLRNPRLRKQAIGAIIGMAIVGLALVGFVLGRQAEIGASLQKSATNEDTFLWRLAGWYQLLFVNPARNPLNDTIGQPFGTGFARVVEGAIVNVQPHNYYVETFLRLGIIGLLLLITLYVWGMRRMKRLPFVLQRYAYPNARFWELVLFLQLIYFFTYGATYDQSILTGIAISGLGLRLRRPAPPQLDVPEAPCAPA